MVSALLLVTGTIVFAAIVILIEESLNFLIRRAAKVAGASSTVIRDIGYGMRVIAIIILASGILSTAGLASEFTALTVSGISAVAISIALQGTLSNIIAGILLFSDGLIRLNDEVEYSGIRGTIVRVALRNTWIRKEDGKIAVVSNSSLSSGPLINHTAVARLSKKYAIEEK